MDQESKVRLIDLIKNLPVLWQPNHKSYGKRGPRDAALKKVAASLGEKGYYLLFIFLSVDNALVMQNL